MLANKYAKILVGLLCVIYVGYQIVSYLNLPPILRMARLETIKYSFSSELDIDKPLSKYFSLGSSKDDVLNDLRGAGFKVSLNSPKQDLPANNQQSYFGLTNISGGILGPLALFSNYDVSIVVDFENEKLVALKSYLFINAL